MNSHGICSALLQPLELLLGQQQQQQQQQRKLSQQEKRRVKGSEFQNLALVCACADGTLLFDRCDLGEGGASWCWWGVLRRWLGVGGMDEGDDCDDDGVGDGDGDGDVDESAVGISILILFTDGKACEKRAIVLQLQQLLR